MSENKEIERKYTVKSSFKPPINVKSQKIIQGYLSVDPERVVRVRTKGDKGFITIKGSSSESGISRFEWEKEILFNDVLSLLPLCLPGVIEKTRYLIPYKDQEFEVDVFFGENEGLIIAELELQNEEQQVYLPDWIDVEVTTDEKYYNSYLTDNPYKSW